ncbi:MAG: DUF3253 domain-containing protein [Alphaproteobacteria bacterium]|nr:MAG: DUF3253 domain-containing protein [Alphaproteobacteria bacterium]
MEARRLILDLLAKRAADTTVCPSEVARALATESCDPTSWRTQMKAVHQAIDDMVANGEVALSWKGQDLGLRSGPYRIRRGSYRV